MDFIDAHRLDDRELREGMKGMKPAEREKYLKDYIGFEDEKSKNESVEEKLLRAKGHIDDLEHQMFFSGSILAAKECGRRRRSIWKNIRMMNSPSDGIEIKGAGMESRDRTLDASASGQPLTE